MKKLILFFICLVCIVSMFAREISLSEARQFATAFIRKQMPMKMQSANPTDYLQLVHTIRQSNHNLIYIFNQGENDGFVIASGDDRVMPILGYSDTGSFDTDNMPDNFRYWLECCEKQIKYAIDNDLSINETSQNIESEDYAPIEPLITTRWGQKAPYNNHFSIDPETGERCVTGCVTTAIAQLMNYHKWPDRGVGELTYDSDGIEMYANYEETEYQWDRMLDSYDENSPQESIDAVAELMQHCGIAFSFGIGSDETVGSYDINCFRYNFKYDFDITFLPDDDEKAIYDELAAGRPVLLAGNAYNNNKLFGHAFICDGYSENGFFHINWGWVGNSDGYYLLSALSPSEREYKFTIGYIIGFIKPAENVAGKRIYFKGDLISTFDKEMSMLSISTGGFYSNQSSPIEGVFGMELTDVEGNVTFVESEPIMFKTSEPQTAIEIAFEKLPKGAYIATPVFRENGKDWEYIIFMNENRYNVKYQSKLYVKSEDVYLSEYLSNPRVTNGTPKAEITTVSATFGQEMLQVELSAKIGLESGDTYNDSLNVALYRKEPDSETYNFVEIARSDEPIVLAGDEEIDIERDVVFTKELNETNSYYIALCNNRRKVCSNYVLIKDSGIESVSSVGLSIDVNGKTLVVQSDRSIESVSVYSSCGTKMIELTGYGTSTYIDLTALPAGLYIVKAMTETAEKTMKIVVK